MIRVLIILTEIAGCVMAGQFCPSFNTTGDPRFTKLLAKDDAVRLGRSIALVCCGAGVDHVAWYRREGNTWKSYPPSSDRSAGTEEHNQVLRIHDANDNDNTTFKCELVKNGIAEKSNEIELHVLICDQLARGPILTDPFPVSVTVDEFNRDVSFACTGYFGCADDNDDENRIVTWQVKGHWTMNISEVDQRYSTKSRTFQWGTKLQSNLTVKSVRQEDLNRTFVCQLVSPQLVKGQSSREVRIYKSSKWNIWMIIGISVGATVVLCIFIFLLTWCIWRLYGPQIKVWREQNSNTYMAKKPISGEELQGLEYNAFIYHAQDDTKVAMEIKNNLEEKNFVAKTSHEIPANVFELTAVQEEIKKSAMVLFVYSQDLRQDNLANLVIHSLVRDSHEKIVFIEMETCDPEEVMHWTNEARNNELQVGRNDDQDIQEDGEVEAADKVRKDDSIDLKFWQKLLRDKFPGEDASDRQKNYFWCSLQTKIPRFEHQVEEYKRKSKLSIKRSSEGRNSTSTKPLLESPVPSPAYMDNTVCRDSLSPASADRVVGNKFTYGEPDQGNELAQCSHSDESVIDRTTSVLVDVDVHEPLERKDGSLATGEEGLGLGAELVPQVRGKRTETGPGVGIENRSVVVPEVTEQSTEHFPENREHIITIDLNKQEETNVSKPDESSESYNSETGVFTLSGEEPHPICNGFENNIAHTDTDLTTNESSREPREARSELPHSYKRQNAVREDKMNGNRSPKTTSCSSPESGYTSMSPDRQKDFVLQPNANNQINV